MTVDLVLVNLMITGFIDFGYKLPQKQHIVGSRDLSRGAKKIPLITMVTEDSQSLDEYILQIFEEQEETFYFPVTTQNTARSFVKALHTKGLPYEKVYKEIGEFEHNFSSWRKGLGRIGIGKRIIERINKPLEDVLLSDDEDNLQDVLAKLKKKEAKQRPDNNRVPPIPDHDDSRLKRIKDNIKKQASEPQEHESWRDAVDAKFKAMDDLQKKSSEPNSPQLRRTGSGRVYGAELEQKEPGIVDFRSILHKRSGTDALNRHSMPPSLPGHDDQVVSNGDRKTWLDQRNETSKNRAESEPKSLPQRDGADVVKSDKTVEAVKTVKRTTPKKQSEEKIDSEKEFENLVEFNEEPLPPSALKKSAPLAAEEEEEESSSSEESEDSSSDDAKSGAEQASNGVAESETSDDDVNDTNYETCESLNETQETEESEESEEESEEEDVGQNYDSEFDEENTHLYSAGSKLSREIIHYKGRVTGHDTPGFVYVFSDRPADSPEPRFKIKASRFPKRRLAQARCFNVDMRMVISFRVSLRSRVMTKITEKLEIYQILGRDGWYQGPSEEISRIVKMMADRYPDNSSEC